MSGNREQHDAAPMGVFQSHATNIPHLSSWIDHLLDITSTQTVKKDFSLRSNNESIHPTTDTLVQSLQRYDCVYKELLRQTSVFSIPVTKMLSKAWVGVMKLMEYMVKSYHRYVRHSSDLQAQAQNLLDENQRGEAANKIKEEEDELGRTHLRARIRCLEAELESMKVEKFGLERENSKMRKIVDIYIKSTEMHESGYDVMNDTAEQSSVDSKGSGAQNFQMKRRDVIDASRMQLKNLNRLDIEINDILSNVGKEENRQRLLMKDLMKLIEKNKGIFTNDTKILINEASKKRDVGVQVDGGDELSIVDDTHNANYVPPAVPPPLAPLILVNRGANVPYLLRKRITNFPKTLRVPPLAWGCQTIMAAYFSKLEGDQELVSKGHAKKPLPIHIHDFFKSLTGLTAYADVQLAQLLQVCEAQKTPLLPRISLFMSQMGLKNRDAMPPLDVRDTDFILDILENLVHQGELTEAKHMSRRKNTAKQQTHFSPAGFAIKPDVFKSTAINAMQTIFKRWCLADGGEDFLFKVRAMTASEKGPRYVDVDELIMLMMEPWQLIRSNWEDHARYIFSEHCIIYRAIAEAMFANDEGVQASDTVVAEVVKEAASDCIRRPLRMFMDTRKGDPSDGTQGNVNKEPVCEVMNRKTFIKVLHVINPTLQDKEIETMFEEALDIAHEAVLSVMETLWQRAFDTTGASKATMKTIDQAEESDDWSEAMTEVASKVASRPFYISLQNTLHTQWMRPYSGKTFRSQDIEIDTFVAILIRKDVFPKTPLVELLHLSPKDLWDNADMFYKQIQERQEREREARIDEERERQLEQMKKEKAKEEEEKEVNEG